VVAAKPLAFMAGLRYVELPEKEMGFAAFNFSGRKLMTYARGAEKGALRVALPENLIGKLLWVRFN